MADKKPATRGPATIDESGEPQGNWAPTSGRALPIMNAVRCLDCDWTYTPVPAFEECPNDDEHSVEVTFVTRTALGFDDDEQYLYPETAGDRLGGVYEYPARVPERSEAYDETTDPLA